MAMSITFENSLFGSPSSSLAGKPGFACKILSLYLSDMPLLIAASCVLAFAIVASLLLKNNLGMATALKTPRITTINISSSKV